MALPSYALGKLYEGEDVTEGQPWQHHYVQGAMNPRNFPTRLEEENQEMRS